MIGLHRAPAALVLVALLTLGACAQRPKQLYAWENFPRQQYESLIHEGASAQDQLLALEAHVQKAGDANAPLPPGLRAHMGLLQLSLGNAAAARDLWLAEKAAFPESAVYMDSLLRRLAASAPPPGPIPNAVKENPA